MSTRANREPVAWRGAARTAIVATLAFVVMGLSSAASASDASGPGVTAVNTEYNALSSDLKRQYFAHKSNAKPQWTPRGGVFQYFWGDSGEGAIYWSPDRTDPAVESQAYAMFGDILVYWKQLGFEDGAGYPYTEEYVPRGSFECPGAQRMQRFDNEWNICWNSTEIWVAHCGCSM